MGIALNAHNQISGRYNAFEIPGIGTLTAAGPTKPTDATPGYAPGCLFFDTNAAAGSQWYVNVGSKASCNFDLFSGSADLSALLATTTELNRAADVSTRLVPCTASTLAVTVAEHDGKIIELDLAAGIAVTLPSLATSLGAKFEFWVKTTFTGAATIKSVASGDIMVGHALMGNDSDNTVVLWQAVAASTIDTIDMLGTGNSTGGIQGQRIVIIGGTGRWYVEITGDAAGTEATPFANTVA